MKVDLPVTIIFIDFFFLKDEQRQKLLLDILKAEEEDLKFELLNQYLIFLFFLS